MRKLTPFQQFTYLGYTSSEDPDTMFFATEEDYIDWVTQRQGNK